MTLSEYPNPFQIHGAASVRFPSSSLFPDTSGSAAQLGFAGITAAQLPALLMKVPGSSWIADI